MAQAPVVPANMVDQKAQQEWQEARLKEDRREQEDRRKNNRDWQEEHRRQDREWQASRDRDTKTWSIVMLILSAVVAAISAYLTSRFIVPK